MWCKTKSTYWPFQVPTLTGRSFTSYCLSTIKTYIDMFLHTYKRVHLHKVISHNVAHAFRGNVFDFRRLVRFNGMLCLQERFTRRCMTPQTCA